MSETTLQFLSLPVIQALCFYLLITLAVVWLVLRVMGSGRLLAFSSATGRVLVSRSAIKGLIARTCRTVEGIGHPQSRIYTRGGKLRARVYIQLRGSTRLSDIATLLQDKLDLALRQNLGIEKIGRIDIIVNDIQSSPKKDSPSAARAGYPWENKYE